MGRRRWSELSGTKKVLVIVGGAIQLGLQAWALWDIRRRPAERIKGSKRLWTAVSFVDYFGPLAYLAFGRKG